MGHSDVWGALGRGLQAAIKYFLTDDTEVIAELVWDDSGSSGSSSSGSSGSSGGSSSGAGGCGKVYGADASASSSLALNAASTSI